MKRIATALPRELVMTLKPPRRLNETGPWYDVRPIAFDGVLHDVNNAGEYVGQRLAASGQMRAVFVRASRVIELGTLGGSSSVARGVNDCGTVVGGALTNGDDAYHAFVYMNGFMYDLNERIDSGDWELIHALGINEHGHILAIGHRAGSDCFVLLNPRRI